MTFRRSILNLLGGRGLVKKSASLSSVLTSDLLTGKGGRAAEINCFKKLARL